MDLQLPIQSVPITTNVVSSNPAQAIQHYVIKFVSDLRQAGGFYPGTPVSSSNKTDRHNIAGILLNVGLNTIILTITLQIFMGHVYSSILIQIFMGHLYSSILIQILLGHNYAQLNLKPKIHMSCVLLNSYTNIARTCVLFNPNMTEDYVSR